MKEITVKTYEFDELSDKAKEVARDWYRAAVSGDDDWNESTIDEAVEQGTLLGIEFDYPKHRPKTPAIWWSGFSSQGDGACFEGTWRASAVQADKVADGWGDAPSTTEIKRIAAEFNRIAKAYPNSSFSVKHRGHYNHEHCTDFEVSMVNDDECDENGEVADMEALSKATEDLIEAAKDFMRWIYRRLESDYEFQNSDEQVEESIRANGYLFTESGSRSTTL